MGVADEIRQKIQNACIKGLSDTEKDVKKDTSNVIEDKIYNAHSPVMYSRTGELASENSMKSDLSGGGNTFELIVKYSDAIHSYNPTWYGEAYPLDEIVFDYFSKSHIYWNKTGRGGVNIKGELDSKSHEWCASFCKNFESAW